MRNNTTPSDLSWWVHPESHEQYQVLHVTNTAATDPRYVPMVVYRRESDQTLWSRPLDAWPGKMIQGALPYTFGDILKNPFGHAHGGGDWREIDMIGHAGFTLVIWRMQDEEDSPMCQETARTMLHALNAAALSKMAVPQ